MLWRKNIIWYDAGFDGKKGYYYPRRDTSCIILNCQLLPIRIRFYGLTIVDIQLTELSTALPGAKRCCHPPIGLRICHVISHNVTNFHHLYKVTLSDRSTAQNFNVNRLVCLVTNLC